MMELLKRFEESALEDDVTGLGGGEESGSDDDEDADELRDRWEGVNLGKGVYFAAGSTLDFIST